ncbi:MAG TPA: hypothetical protein VGF69_05390 [Thermoanaerobaculia bacterium]|jgi:hypothetical protein
MLPHGDDTLRETAPELVITSAIDKGWAARIPKRGTYAEFPGTPVNWDGEFFEVTAVVPLANGKIEYVLEPWRDELVMRGLVRYDEASEAQRIAERAAAKQRERRSVATSLLAIFTGHLPGAVQTRLASELGVVATRLTIVSTIPPLLFFVVVMRSAVSAIVDKRPVPFGFGVGLLALYLAFDSAFRFFIAWTYGRPIGSPFGFAGYILYYLCARDQSRLVPPVARPPAFSRAAAAEPSDDIALQDLLKMRKAFFTLLTPAEQKTLARRYGYVYGDDATVVAFILLLFAGAGAVTSWLKLTDGFSVTAILSLLTAAFIAGEQCLRLSRFRHGPAGSVLAPLVRPLARKLLQ